MLFSREIIVRIPIDEAFFDDTEHAFGDCNYCLL